MVAKTLDGKKFSNQILNQCKKAVSACLRKKMPRPTLATILVGDNAASHTYVKHKIEACEKIGIKSYPFYLPKDIEESVLLELIEELNQNKKIHGILVQLPLPKHIDTQLIINSIEPSKDVDGFHPYNLGLLATRMPILHSCTPAGIMALLKNAHISLKGKHVVIVGASLIVGLPSALEALMQDATITICHEFTKNLSKITREADILIVAIGHPHFISEKHIKKNAVVIDVGINRLKNGKIVGDVNFKTVSKKASYLTPVPGGVGPMTVAMLMQNTILVTKIQSKLS